MKTVEFIHNLINQKLQPSLEAASAIDLFGVSKAVYERLLFIFEQHGLDRSDPKMDTALQASDVLKKYIPTLNLSAIERFDLSVLLLKDLGGEKM